ncbi:MAG TPA: ATP-binding cassette domain-containing protein, partial [Gemmataceae bacterium]
MNTTDPILQAEQVCKSFKEVRAVRDVSFAVRRGEVFALLGPNGAGKTTLVRMILGIIRPDDGTITFRIHGDAAPPSPADLGYLPEDRGLYKDIPILRTLVYFGMLRGMTRAAARKEAEFWLERMGLRPRANDKLETLSKGNQQKVQFVSAVLHRPAFAVLDEPFSGLDPLNQDFFLELLRELRDSGMTVLLSAHQMALVEQVADRVFLMNHGREVRCGTLAELRDGVALGTRIGFRYREGADLAPLTSH